MSAQECWRDEHGHAWHPLNPGGLCWCGSTRYGDGPAPRSTTPTDLRVVFTNTTTTAKP